MKKKMKKGQAVLSAWTLIAAMGLTPVLSVSYPNGIATVYAKEAVNEAVEEAGTAPRPVRQKLGGRKKKTAQKGKWRKQVSPRLTRRRTRMQELQI